MPAKVGYLVIDEAGPERLASFWCGLLAVTVDAAAGLSRGRPASGRASAGGAWRIRRVNEFDLDVLPAGA